MAYERITAGQQVLVIHNLTGSAQTMQLHSGTGGITYAGILRSVGGKAALGSGRLTLPAYTTVILE